jgi:hypothetical protein
VPNVVLLRVTIDRQVIWPQRRDARPSTFEGDERPWPLFFNIGPLSSGPEEVSLKKFFAEFEQADLAFVYREYRANGELDELHEFVRRAAVPELIMSGELTITEQPI